MFGLSYAERSAAGAYEQQRFEEGRRAWRRRVLPRLRWTLLLPCAAAIGYELVRPSTLHFMAGFLTGALTCCYLWARHEVPWHVQRHGDGAEGERATAKVLGPLRREGWHLAHNLNTGRGNRDHIVVGPGGVLLLDSKRLGGTVTINGDTVCVERVDDARDSYELRKLAGSLRGEASRLHDEILQATGVWTWVTPVVVIWSRFDARIFESDRIFFIHGDELVGWLRKLVRRLDDEAARRLSTAIA